MKLRLSISPGFISVSSAIDRYMQMFDNLPNIEKYRPRIEKKVSIYITDFKKADRIIWMCKYLKSRYYKRALVDKIITKPEYEKLLKTIKQDHCTPNGSTDLTTLYESLRHYFSLHVASIDNYEFKTQSPNVVLADLENMEAEWKTGNRVGAVPEDGKKIVVFPDGSAWFNLGKEFCTIEGKAMGHCGNEGDPQPGDQVLSYRTPGKNNYWVPHLTFILTKNGYISEMKGRGNEKPAAKYHPQIIKLLESPIVKGIKGGGYLPEHNFSVMDLTEAERKTLVAKKPTLMTFLEWVEDYKSSKDNSILPHIKKFLQADDSPKALKEPLAVMRDPTTPTEILELGFLVPSLKLIALKNTNLDQKILGEQADILDTRDLLYLLDNRSLSESVLLKLATKSKSPMIRSKVMSHINATPRILKKGCSDKQSSVIRAALGNTNIGEKVLRTMYVKYSAPEDFRYRVAICENDICPDDILSQAAEDESYEVVYVVAQNILISPSIVRKASKQLTKLKDSKPRHIHKRAAPKRLV